MTVEEKELLEELKNYLDITWKDEKQDKKLAGMLKRGMAALEVRLGTCDFYGETREKALLFILVMYEQSGELAQFWESYKTELLGIQIAREVEGYAAAEQQTV